jgi:recombination protein RecR
MTAISRYLDAVVRELSRLPGIGPKSASRLAFHLLKMKDNEVEALSRAILELKKNISRCGVCGGISDGGLCSICADPDRQDNSLCIVEESLDIISIEKTGEFRGRYHVLGGVISPLDGIGPDELNIRKAREVRRWENQGGDHRHQSDN